MSVPFAIMWTISPLLDVLVEADRLDDADALVASAPLPETLPDYAAAAAFLTSRGALRHAQGRSEEAMADLRESARVCEELELRSPVLAAWRIPARRRPGRSSARRTRPRGSRPSS